MEVKKIFGVIVLDYVHTSKKLADQFTKGLSCSVIDRWNLFRTKLPIQGIVHYVVVVKCSLGSRWIFNLTVFIETPVYQTFEMMRAF